MMIINDKQMKCLVWAGFAVAASGVVLMLSAAGAVWYGHGEKKGNDQQVPSISVTGEADAYAKPDVATLDFSVSSQKKTQQEASADVNKTAGALIAQLKQQGIADTDIKTLSYDLNPEYDYLQSVCPSPIMGVQQICPPGKQVLRDYAVTQRIEIAMKGSNFDNASSFVDTVTNGGATDVGQLDFKVQDQEAVKAEARSKAIIEAKGKAEKLAGELGVHLVRITNFNESNDMPFFARANVMAMDATGAAAPAPKAVLPTGQNQYHSSVNITYEISGKADGGW